MEHDRFALGHRGTETELSSFTQRTDGADGLMGWHKHICQNMFEPGKERLRPAMESDEETAIAGFPRFRSSAALEAHDTPGTALWARFLQAGWHRSGDRRASLLDVKEIDAVAIVTPDHWHAIPTVSAFEAERTCSSKSLSVTAWPKAARWRTRR
jgi:hypothetical protein